MIGGTLLSTEISIAVQYPPYTVLMLLHEHCSKNVFVSIQRLKCTNLV